MANRIIGGMNDMAAPSLDALPMRKIRKVTWTPGKVLAIETKDDIWILAQIVDDAHIAFFDTFAKARRFRPCDWAGANLLCVKKGSTLFLRNSNCFEITLKSKAIQIPKAWINTKMHPRYKKIVLWEGTKDERRLKIEYSGSLVDNNLELLIPRIRLNDSKTINNHELAGVATFPYTNYRFYLCYKLQRNADPEKELVFRRQLPVEYKFIIDGLYRKDQF
jgi:hypothetical protein